MQAQLSRRCELRDSKCWPQSQSQELSERVSYLEAYAKQVIHGCNIHGAMGQTCCKTIRWTAQAVSLVYTASPRIRRSRCAWREVETYLCNTLRMILRARPLMLAWPSRRRMAVRHLLSADWHRSATRWFSNVTRSTHTCEWLWQRTRSTLGPLHAEPLKGCQNRLQLELIRRELPTGDYRAPNSP